MRRTMTEQQLEQIAALRREKLSLQLYWPGVRTIPQYRKIHLPAQRVCRQWDAED